MAGRVVGINTAIFSRSGGSHGIGFAIPVQPGEADRRQRRDGPQARAAVARRQARCGDARDGRGHGAGRVAGAMVTRLYAKSPAAEAGLQAGDVIVGVDGHEVADARAVAVPADHERRRQPRRLDIVRKGKRSTVDVALRAAPQAGKDDVRNLSGDAPLRRRARQPTSCRASPTSSASRSRRASSSCRCGPNRRLPASASSRAT